MSMAIYLKSFSAKLVVEANKKITQMNQARSYKEEGQLLSITASSQPGFAALKRVTELFVQCCLDNNCELRFKAQLKQSIHT